MTSLVLLRALFLVLEIKLPKILLGSIKSFVIISKIKFITF